MENGKAYCNACERIVDYKIKELKSGKLAAYCLVCGKRLIVPEVEKHNKELESK